jgi:transcriptional regulator with XRE-family HTH domain
LSSKFIKKYPFSEISADTHSMNVSGENLVERIGEIIDQKRLKRVDLYKIAPSGTLSAWKQGQEPRAYTICRVAEFLGTSLDYLLLGKSSDNLNQGEQTILNAFNQLNAEGKENAIFLVKALETKYPLSSEQAGALSKTAT